MNLFRIAIVIPEATQYRRRVSSLTAESCRILTNNQVPVSVVPNCFGRDIRKTGVKFDGIFNRKFYHILRMLLQCTELGLVRWSHSVLHPEVIIYIQDDVKMSKFFYYRLIWSNVFMRYWRERGKTEWMIVGGINHFIDNLNQSVATFHTGDVYDVAGWGAQMIIFSRALAMSIMNAASPAPKAPIQDDLITRKHARVIRVINPPLYQHSVVGSVWCVRKQFLRTGHFKYVDKRELPKLERPNHVVPFQYIKALSLACTYLDSIKVREKDVNEVIMATGPISQLASGCDIPVRIVEDKDANFWIIRSDADMKACMEQDERDMVIVMYEPYIKGKYYYWASAVMENNFHDAWDYCFVRLRAWKNQEFV